MTHIAQALSSVLAARHGLRSCALAVIAAGGAATLAAQTLVESGHHILTARGERNGLGISLAAPGDVNGDRVPDVAVGAPRQTVGAFTTAGRVLVLSGADGRLLWQVDGSATGQLFGAIVRPVGDVDRDGRPDVLALGVNVARICSGRTGGVLLTWRPASIVERPGAAVGVGDVNGDGIPDFALGSAWPAARGPYTGAVFFYSGKDGRRLHRLDGPVADGLFGRSLAMVGDVDRDGFDDLAIGSMSENLATRPRAGAVRVYSGRTRALLWTSHGPATRSYLGIAVAAAGDVDRDGYPDVIASGVHKSDRPRTVVLLSGRDGRRLRIVPEPAGMFASVYCIGGVGDLDRDRYDEYAVGYFSPTDPRRKGEVHVFSGRTHALLHKFVTPLRKPLAIAALDDVNCDNAPDLAIASRQQAGGGIDGTVSLVSSVGLSLSTDVHRVSARHGGTQRLFLDAGPGHAGKRAWFLGSLSGTKPGFQLGFEHVPLNIDGYLLATAATPGPIVFDTGPRLDANGRGRARLTLPALPLPELRANHAFVVLGRGGVDLVSNAAPLWIAR